MAYKIDLFDASGKKLKQKSVDTNVFNDENVNDSLIHEFVLMQLANKRVAIAHTKTRGDITASGRKLYRQKGTGRARVGDAASPIRRKGGVAFGPRNNRNFSKDMPKKMRRKALFGSLTLKARDSEVIAIDDFKISEIKTKEAVKVLSNLKIDSEKTLLVLSEKDETIMKSFKNIPNVKYILVNYLNPYDLLTHKKVLFAESALDMLKDVFVK